MKWRKGLFTISIIPIIIAIYWSVSLFRLIYALLKNRKTPETVNEEGVEERVMNVIISSILFVLCVVVAIISANTVSEPVSFM